MNLVRRFASHLSYANVVASLALFAALGGSAYAASQINGGSIVKHSIGANKLKNETLTSKQIKKGSLNSSVINLSTLGTVPSAQTAVTAQTATSATSATTAASANTANSAKTADQATSAETATTATSAGHATTADSATSADSATTASHADTAADAETLEGETATDLTLSCPAETDGFIGMCWDENEQGARTWLEAIQECAERGGRLPTISELIAYAELRGSHLSGENWSGDVDSVPVGEKERVFTSDASGRHTVNTTVLTTLPYRCVFYPSNG